MPSRRRRKASRELTTLQRSPFGNATILLVMDDHLGALFREACRVSPLSLELRVARRSVCGEVIAT